MSCRADVPGAGCETCLRGYESSCVLGPKMSGVHLDGTFRQYMVTSARYVTRIPAEIDMAEAAPVLCAGVTCLRGLKEARLNIGDWVAIPGAGGGLGHLAVQYAVALGQRVIGIDTGADKRAMVEGYGAKFIDFKESSVRPFLAQLAGRRLHPCAGPRRRDPRDIGRTWRTRSSGLGSIGRCLHPSEAVKCTLSRRISLIADAGSRVPS